MILATSELKKIIDDLVDSSSFSEIRGSSIDLAIGEKALIPKGGVINLFENKLDDAEFFDEIELAKGYDLNPGCYMYASSAEKVSIPKDKCAILLPRSTLSRMGLLLPSSMYANPGYEGHLPIIIHNASPFVFKIPPYYRVMQMILCELKGEASVYKEQNDAKYFGEKSTLKPLFDDFNLEDVLKKINL